MPIVDEDIQRVRELTDAVALVGAHVGLRRVGRRQVGLCPFHEERTPSFSVNAEEGLYYCFGCGASGDVITFVQRIEGLDFPGAVEHLADRAGLQLRYTDPEVGQRRRRNAELHEVVERAVEWYHRRLLADPAAGAARAYLRSRGYDGEIVRRFRLGWAPDAWDLLSQALRDAGEDQLVQAGLSRRGGRGGLIDVFRSRVLFPVLDVSGRSIGFGGRILPGGEGPKYKNSHQGPLYDKGRVLYGLSWAKQRAVERGRLVVCEGYTDVIAFASVGVTEAVATCGTALTEDHVRAMRRFARRIVLAFDADDAGALAAERVYAWERAHDLEVAVVDLGAGRDPGDVASVDPDGLVAAVGAAEPLLGWRVRRLLDGVEGATPERRAAVAHRALDTVAEHPDELVRDQYVMSIAGRCDLDVARLRAALGPHRDGRGGGRDAGTGPPTSRSGRTARPGEPGRGGRGAGTTTGLGDRAAHDGGALSPGGTGTAAPASPAELEALRVLAGRPAEIAHRLHPGLFPTPAAASAYAALAAAASPRLAAAQLDAPAAALVRRAAVEHSDAEVDGVMLPLVRRAGERAAERLHRRFAGTSEWRDHAPLLSWVSSRLAELADDHTRDGALDALSGWLASWEEAAA